MKLGIIARCDDSGLGNQTHELVKMLNPHKIFLIDSSPFNGHKQNYEWYEGRNVMRVSGVPAKPTVLNFIRDVDVVLSCETFYNKNFVPISRNRKVKTILQYNYEFLDYLTNRNKPLPDILLSPSFWKLDEIKEDFGNKTRVGYLPPPTDSNIFDKNRLTNLKDSKRILHVAGKAAMHDRNGTRSVIEMLTHSKEDYELVIRTQTELDIDIKDDRVKIIVGNEKHREDMYKGFDAMILPRRYAGLCLPMNEALMSGLPVFMTDVSPNNQILPQEWLAQCGKTGSFQTKAEIDIFNANPEHLGFIIDEYMKTKDKTSIKEKAFNLGYENFSSDILKDKYLEIINGMLT
jgi:glycosyltransferase involved in cell wall biosynthesis